MRLNILSDSHWEARLGPILNELSDTMFRQRFEGLDYGKGLTGVTVVFMCQDPSLNLKRRIRHSKKEAKVYLDIMLDLPTMKGSTPVERKRIVAQSLYDEVPSVLGTFKIVDFDRDSFVSDFCAWIDGLGWR